MPAQSIRSCVARLTGGWLLALSTGGIGLAAEPVVGPALGNFQMVQRVDDVLYGVDAVSLEILDQRHVRGTFVRVSVERPSPILGYTRFIADCREPVGLALVSSSNLTGKTHPDGSPQYLEVRAEPLPIDAMDYQPGALLDGTQMVAQFACRVSLRPGAAPAIAQELYEGGGPADMRSLKCTLLPDGEAQPVIDVPLRYSESAQAVAVNRQWLASSVVTPRQIQFGSGYDKWTIDRQSGQAQLLRADGSLRFASKCTPQ
ncbi:MAG: hypothetical protein ABI212_10185 [Burkholderiaceae bacterium]